MHAWFAVKLVQLFWSDIYETDDVNFIKKCEMWFRLKWIESLLSSINITC